MSPSNAPRHAGHPGASPRRARARGRRRALGPVVAGLAMLASLLLGCGKDVPAPAEAVPATPETYLAGWAEPAAPEMDSATGYPTRIRRLRDGAEMVLIPAGTFLMGAVPGDQRAKDNEKPQHQVTLTKAYYTDRTEVSIEQWKKFVAEGGGQMPDLSRNVTNERAPIHNVTWESAVAFAKWARVTLPTEAQWERAARGGTDGRTYPWGTKDDPTARNGEGSGQDSFLELAPVGSFPANAFGLFDMCGNAMEWCLDAGDYAPYASGPATDPVGHGAGNNRAMRDGSYLADRLDLRTSCRRVSSRMGGLPVLGFRCAKPLP